MDHVSASLYPSRMLCDPLNPPSGPAKCIIKLKKKKRISKKSSKLLAKNSKTKEWTKARENELRQAKAETAHKFYN